MDVCSQDQDTWTGRAAQWLALSGELFVVTASDASLQNKLYSFLVSVSQLHYLVRNQRRNELIFVFKQKQLPLRGFVSPHFISSAKELITKDEIFTVVGLPSDLDESCVHRCGTSDFGKRALARALKDQLGQRVAFGKCPLSNEDQEFFLIK